MKITPKNVCQILDSVEREGSTLKELLLALNQRGKKKALLRRTLQKLLRKDLCFKHNNRYFSRKKTSKVAGLNKGISAARKISNLRPAISKRKPRGVFLVKGGRGVIHSFAENRNYLLEPKTADGLIHGDTVNFVLVEKKRRQDVAKVTEIIERKISTLTGKVIPQKKDLWHFMPDSPLFPKIFKVKSHPWGNVVPRENVQFSITRYAVGNRVPEGRLVKEMPRDIKNHKAYTDLIAENRILTKFPVKVLQACDRFSTAVRFKTLEKRKDLRRLPFITIDGSDAKDFDDSIYAQKEEQNYRIWVSIADVADYVKTGSDLDREAFSRGTSIYLPGTVIPMIPEVLSNRLCSLNENVNRKTITCEMLIDSYGHRLDFKIYPSMIRVVCRLTYPEVDNFLETGKLKQRKSFAELNNYLDLYSQISKTLAGKRRRGGAIDFSLPETNFAYGENNQLLNISRTFQTKAMKVIEQFMLEANETVAEYCFKNNIPIIWRNHPPPFPDKIDGLKQLFSNYNIKLPIFNLSRNLNLALEKVKNSPFEKQLVSQVLRSMCLAVYETECKGHFGLASSRYCHFTSPIRRYADLLVHRAIKSFWSGGKVPDIPAYFAINISEREQLAASVERSAEKLIKMLFVADKIGETFTVKVSGFLWNGLLVEIEYPYVEGVVHLETIHDDRYYFEQQKYWMLGRKNRRKIRIGTSFKAILVRLDEKNRRPEFTWLGWIQVE